MNKLKKARLKLGLSQEKVAEKIGVAQRTYAHWEKSGIPEENKKVIKATDELLELMKIPRSQLKNL